MNNVLKKKISVSLRGIQGKFSRYYALILTEKNLTIPQFSLLLLITDEAPLKMSEIAEKMHLAVSSVTNLVDRLEARQLAERQAHPTDRRVHLIKPTKKALTLVQELREKTIGAIANHLQSFSNEEAEIILRFYDSLSSTLDSLLITAGGKRNK